MKHLTTLLILLFLSNATFAQKLKDKLQGNWVCTEILDSLGNKTNGKFGSSDDYLKFSFEKGNLSIVEAPFDRGLKIPLKFGADYIDILPGAMYKIPERIYNVKSVDNNNLILTTKNERGQQIEYHFENQSNFAKDVSSDKILDYGTIQISHFKMSKEETGSNRAFNYIISNNKANLIPSPIFTDQASATFGFYVSINFIFPKTYPFETTSKELVLDFDVTKEGATNIRIEKGLSDQMNSSLLKIIEKSKKKWTIEDKTKTVTMRLHFIFYQGAGD
jgi:hypothetical protein